MCAVAALLIALVGCEKSPFNTVCTDEARPGLLVSVRDSISGAAVSEARVIARTGTTADTSSGAFNGLYPLAYEKAGIYQVLVEHTDYRTWVRANVRVTADECHVQSVSLTALLQRQP